MTQRIEPVEPDSTDDEEVKAFLEETGAFMYGLENRESILSALARKPEISKGFMTFIEATWESEDVEKHIKELMRIKSADTTQCTYCATVRIDDGVRDDVGPKEDAVLGVIDEDKLTRREALAVRLAEKMADDPNYITDEFWEEISEEFTDDEIVELVATGAQGAAGQTIASTLRLNTEEESLYPTELEYPLQDSEEVTRPGSNQ